MSKRLEKLAGLVAAGETDPFVHYGLAMEYRSLGRNPDALRTFVALRATHPGYLPMYLICGQLLIAEGKTIEAREWLTTGLELAGTQGNPKARSELAEALAELD